jgi:hypothetical protein
MGVSKDIAANSVLLQKASTANGTSDEATVSIGGTHVYTVNISTGAASVQLQCRPYGFSDFYDIDAPITAVGLTPIAYDCPSGATYRDVVSGISGGAVVTSSIGYAGGEV